MKMKNNNPAFGHPTIIIFRPSLETLKRFHLKISKIGQVFVVTHAVACCVCVCVWVEGSDVVVSDYLRFRGIADEGFAYQTTAANIRSICSGVGVGGAVQPTGYKVAPGRTRSSEDTEVELSKRLSPC